MWIPLRPLTTSTRKNGLFVALRWAIPNPKAQYLSKNAWISDNTWRLVGIRASARRDPAHEKVLLQHLRRYIAVSLKADRRRRVKTDGGKIEALLASDLPLYKEDG